MRLGLPAPRKIIFRLGDMVSLPGQSRKMMVTDFDFDHGRHQAWVAASYIAKPGQPAREIKVRPSALILIRRAKG